MFFYLFHDDLETFLSFFLTQFSYDPIFFSLDELTFPMSLLAFPEWDSLPFEYYQSYIYVFHFSYVASSTQFTCYIFCKKNKLYLGCFLLYFSFCNIKQDWAKYIFSFSFILSFSLAFVLGLRKEGKEERESFACLRNMHAFFSSFIFFSFFRLF